MSYTVRFAPEALQHLEAIEAFLASAGSPAIAARHVDAIVAYCESLALFPHRGLRRGDLESGLRITNHAGKVVIAFEVDARAMTVSILGVYRGGQDYAIRHGTKA